MTIATMSYSAVVITILAPGIIVTLALAKSMLKNRYRA
jgi:hypothetical protein